MSKNIDDIFNDTEIEVNQILNFLAKQTFRPKKLSLQNPFKI
jgi:hypothetical protein